ncbi:hypothetical protein [Thermoanaerobacterium thermosaccharolyticum]|uniref:hypothetical protein n=1 Tax=Thermoanaerobacterium thermosaccharolyticum TaxID=1517 RepID=UPI003DA9C2C9
MSQEIKVDLKYLLNTYNDIEKARMNLYLAVNKCLRSGEKPDIVLPCDDVKAEMIDDIVKITVPDFPAELGPVKGVEKNRWIDNIMYALEKLDKNIYFDHAFIFIKFFTPVKNCDIDNWNIKPIIDAIKKSLIIYDDDYEHLSFGFNASFSEEPKTEIYIFNYNELEKFLPKIL